MRGAYRDAAAIIAALVLLVLLPAASFAAPLLKGSEDWGAPPPEDYAQALLPALPQFAGWYRFMGAGEYPNIHAADYGLAVTGYGGMVTAYRSTTGEELWRFGTGEYSVLSAKILPSQVLMTLSGQLLALDSASGRELWRADKYELVAVSDDGAWVTLAPAEYDYANFDKRSGIVLLDSATGKVLHSYDTGVFKTGPFGVINREEAHPLKSEGAIALLEPDGTRINLPSPRPSWGAVFAQQQDCLLVAEYPQLDTSHDWTRDDYEQALANERLDPATGQPGADLILSCFELPAGTLRWRRELTGEAYQYFYGNGIEIVGEDVWLWQMQACEAFALSDGSTVGLPQVAGVEGAGPPDMRDGNWLYYDGCRIGLAPGSWAVLDITTGQTRVLELDLPSRPTLDHDSHTALFILQEQGTGRAYANTDGVLAVQLGQDGKPADGTISVLSKPDVHAELCRRFLASADPRADAALMRDVVTTGINALARIAEQVDPGNSAQLDSLLAAAVYMNAKRGEDYRESDAVSLLCEILQNRYSPVLSAQVAGWIDLDELSERKHQLAAVLARSGGPDAIGALGSYYDGLAIAHHIQPAPKQLVPPIPAEAAQFPPEDVDIYDLAGRWAETKSPDGVRIAIFTAAGMLTDRDLYIAVDEQNDGVWDELLPSGLQDISFSHGHPLGPRGPGPSGKLSITWKDGALHVMHHRLVMEEVTRGEGEEKYTSSEMKSAERFDTALTLDDLRRDSDGDGLTDLTEKMLPTDTARADSDGDGLSDSEDPAPLADPAKMGPLERGVARSLKYFFASEDQGFWANAINDADADSSELVQPWSARYMLLFGCGQVAYSGDAATYGISLSNKNQRASFVRGLGGYVPMGMLRVNCAKPGEATAPDAEAAPSSADGAQSGTGETQAGTGDEEPASYLMAATSFDEVETDPDTALVVTVDFWLSGYVILLTEIDGEYYPYRSYMTWIS